MSCPGIPRTLAYGHRLISSIDTSLSTLKKTYHRASPRCRRKVERPFRRNWNGRERCRSPGTAYARPRTSCVVPMQGFGYGQLSCVFIYPEHISIYVTRLRNFSLHVRRIPQYTIDVLVISIDDRFLLGSGIIGYDVRQQVPLDPVGIGISFYAETEVCRKQIEISDMLSVSAIHDYGA